MGTSFPRLDIPAKVTGGAIYVQDMRLPGMLFGRVARPPSYQAKLVSVDLDAVRAMPGVVAVVRDGRFLGVVAEREEQAVKARLALTAAAQWEVPATLPDPARLHAELRARKTDDTVASEKKGDAPAGGAAAERHLHQALHRACLDRAVRRAGAVRGRWRQRAGLVA